MPVDATLRQLLDALAAASAEAPSILDQDAPTARAAMAGLNALAIPEEVASIEERTIPGPAGDIALRIYRPEAQGPLPVLVWYHGGGWVIGDLDSADGPCRALCRRAGILVVSVDYRLAPEHPFPAAIDDAEAAFDWVVANAAELGGAADQVAVGGDSAGGNLAAVVAQARKGQVAHQLLVYPVTDATLSHPSIEENGEGYLLTKDHMVWFAGHYVGDGDRTDPRVSPLHGDPRGTAPAFVLTAEFDPLRDEGEAYASAMAEAGVDVQHRRYDGMIHAFFQMSGVTPVASQAIDDAAEALRGAFS